MRSLFGKFFMTAILMTKSHWLMILHYVFESIPQVMRNVWITEFSALVAVEVRKRTLYWKLILQKWCGKFSYNFDMMSTLNYGLPIVLLWLLQ